MRVVKVLKRDAEEVRRRLAAENIISKDYLIESDEKYVYIPVASDMHELPADNEMIEREMKKRRRGPHSLRDALGDDSVRAYDVIGDIAVIEIPDGLRDRENEIGETLLKLHKNLKCVFAKDSGVHGEYRIRGVRWLAGEKRTETLHREHGARFVVDVSKAYFSPRLSYERLRIARQVRDGENILALFGGVAPFPIVIARKKNVHAYSIEINPEGHKYALKNIELNKVGGRVTALCGDVREILKEKRFHQWADRIIMPLPKDAISFLPYVVHTAKKGCIIHVYAFCEKGKLGALEQEILRLLGRPAEIIYSRRVRTYSPEVDQFVFDIKVLE